MTQEPRIKELRDKMAIEFQPHWAHSLAEMAIQLDDGTTIEVTHDPGIPWADLEKQRAGDRDQVRQPGDAAAGRRRRRRLHDAIERIDSLTDVGELVRASAKN